MTKRIRQIAPLLGMATIVNAEEVTSSSSGFLTLPDTLSNELSSVAQEGFWHGFAIASGCMIACSMIVIAMHLINRGAGR